LHEMLAELDTLTRQEMEELCEAIRAAGITID
jgi:hypothetical protein